MLLNKVLFVSLLVIGLCCFQAAYGLRLQERIAGGFQAVPGQFPFVVAIKYTYADPARGGAITNAQVTGLLYNLNTVISTVNAFAPLFGTTGTNSVTVIAGSTDTNIIPAPPTAQVQTFLVTSGLSGAAAPANLIFQKAPAVPANFFDDAVVLKLPAPFTANANIGTIRLPSSSPVPDEPIFAIGFGEISPGAIAFPQLTYVQTNLRRHRLCFNDWTAAGQISKIDFAKNFCLQGKVHNVNGSTPNTLTDICVLDWGGAIIRSTNVAGIPAQNYEVLGLINYGTCTTSLPAIATYLFKIATVETLPDGTVTTPFVLTNAGAQVAPPAPLPAGANLNSVFGNFACGDGIIQPQFEKCDPGTAIDNCCNAFECQFQQPGTPCTIPDILNGTICKTKPICDSVGKCKSRNKRGRRCNGPATRCNKGRCINNING